MGAFELQGSQDPQPPVTMLPVLLIMTAGVEE